MNRQNYPGLYIHVPFCGSKCPYCDFYSVPSLAEASQWLKAIEQEGMFYKEDFPTFDSLYLGGGTPSTLGDQDLKALMTLLCRLFHFLPDAEITLEANPDDINREKASLLRDLGINRISLGVQSFNDSDLRFLQRRHSSKQAERALDLFKRTGFSNISIDLIYGLPVQREEDWIKTLDRALTFEPSHISCYQLNIAQQTPFGGMLKQGIIHPLGEDRERSFFLLTSEFLKGKGYIHYEVSNYSRDRESFCRHNAKYWHRKPYLGLGPSAHSFSGTRRWWNFRSVKAYCRDLSTGRMPIDGEEHLTGDQSRLETLMLGFRTLKGINADLFRTRSQDQKVLGVLKESGLIKIEESRVVPTREGFLVANSLPLLFCGP